MNTILDRISKGQHVSLSRFNDGEVGALRGNLKETSRSHQKVTPELVERLKWALHYRKEGYYIGIPCPICYPTYFNYVRRQLDLGTPEYPEGYPHQILAVSTTNNHYHYFKGELMAILRNKNVGIVADRKVQLPLTDVTWYICDEKNADSQVEEVFVALQEHDYYILTIGASSRWLAAKLHEAGKNALDLGSIFDPEKNRPLPVHEWKGKYGWKGRKYCPICNY
jgi:hypothetical protein